MRFYFTQPEDPPDEDGVEFADADSALEEAAHTALSMMREQPKVTDAFTLNVASTEGPVGSVTVKVTITR